jgi:hypothetical protein
MTHEQASQGTAILGVDLRTPVTVKTVNLPVDIAVKFLQNRQTRPDQTWGCGLCGI